jgi:hypothetical protein
MDARIKSGHDEMSGIISKVQNWNPAERPPPKLVG